MPLWLVEVRTHDGGDWEVAAVEWEKEMARAIQDELEADAIWQVRAHELSDLPPEKAEELIESASQLQVDRWDRYRFRAMERLYRERRDRLTDQP